VLADDRKRIKRICDVISVSPEIDSIPPMINRLIATLKPQSNGPSYSTTVIGTLAVDGWTVTFGTARMGLDGAAARRGPSSLYQM